MIVAEEKEILLPLCTANLNMVWGGIMAEILACMGLEQAVISPGSRSGPLAVGFGTNSKIEAIPVLDERSAAFFALGLAKQSHKPIALICSSGTAAANYYPAIIEARMSKVPLIVLTADRPSELRECHSGQTIDQVKLYGDHVNFYKELALPEESVDMLKYLRQTMIHAFERAIFPQAGVVHLNVPFRDPLAPIRDEKFQEFLRKIDLEDFLCDVSYKQQSRFELKENDAETLLRKMKSIDQGLIVVGPNQPADSGEFVKAISNISYLTGWPVIAEGLSPLRGNNHQMEFVSTKYDLILRNKHIAEKLKPEAVLCVGPLPTSKVLRAWLKECDAQTWILEDSADNIDPLHRKTTYLRVSIQSFAENITELRTNSRRENNYLWTWKLLEKQAIDGVCRELQECNFLFEGKVALELSQHLPKYTPVFASTSMPVRDVEYFWESNDRGCEMYFNRGANGLDGLVSTAFGVAHKNKPTVLLIGDLGLLHDSNGLLLKKYFKGSLTIVVINNEGGGIFEYLPISQFGEFFEKYVATPQSIEFKKLAAMHEVEYHNPDTWKAFRAFIQKLPECGIRIIEVKADRKKDATFRKDLFKNLSQQLSY